MGHETPQKQPRWGSIGRQGKGQAIRATIERVAGDRVNSGLWIDIGCGNGEIAGALANGVRQVVGIDPEPWSEWNRLSDAIASLRFLNAEFDSSRLPIDEGIADVIVCNQVYEHVQNPRQLIENIYAVLKPGGCCYFAGPNLLWPVEPHVKLPFVHWLPRGFAHRVMKGFGMSDPQALDAFSYSSWALVEMFRAAGFRVEEGVKERALSVPLVCENKIFEKTVKMVPRRLLWWLMPLLPGFVFILKKPQDA